MMFPNSAMFPLKKKEKTHLCGEERIISSTWQKPRDVSPALQGRRDDGHSAADDRTRWARWFAPGRIPWGLPRATAPCWLSQRAAPAPHCPGNLHANITVNVLSALGRGVIE